MRNFVEKLGVVMFIIGVVTADNENVIIPASLAILGCVMLLFASKEDCNE